MRISRRRQENQSGFALLLVFAMAAAAVVLIYLELPRVAFENMRNKEEMLVERGEQYQRAIQLYVRKNNKYPKTLEDLETTNNIRFLRKRYKDPMTGEDEWRMIHVDDAGQYTDSLIHKKEEDKKKPASVLASNIQGIGESAEYLPSSQQQGTQNPYATARRQSEVRAQQGMQPGMTTGSESSPNDPTQPQPDPQQSQQNQQQYPAGQAPGDNNQIAQPRFSPGNPAANTSVQQAPPGFGTGGNMSSSGFGSNTSAQGAGNRMPNFPSQGANSQVGGQIGSPIGASGASSPPGLLTPRGGGTLGGQTSGGQTQSGQQGQQGGGFGFGGGFGMGSGGQTQTQPATGGTQGGMQGGTQGSAQSGFQGGMQGSTGSGFQGSQSSSQSGFSGSTSSGGFGSSPFGSTQPGQGAPNQAIQAIRGILSGGRPNQQQQTAGTGAAIPGGIAGVASKRDMQGIKVYNERTNYKEWEFLFDMKKELEARGKKANPGTPGLGPGGANQQGTSGMGGMGQGQGQTGQGPTSGFGGFGSSGTTRPAPGGFGSGSSFGKQ